MVLKWLILKTESMPNEVRDNLIEFLNEFTSYVACNCKSLNEEQFLMIINLCTVVQVKVIRSYQVLTVPYRIRSSCVEQIDPNVVDNLAISEDDSVQTDIEAKQKMTRIFQLRASEVLTTEFDSSSAKLLACIDAEVQLVL